MKARTVIKLIIASLFVGLILVSLGITPVDFWREAGNLAVRVGNWLVNFFKSALIYIIVGAAVVVPIYIAHRFLKRRKGKKI